MPVACSGTRLSSLLNHLRPANTATQETPAAAKSFSIQPLPREKSPSGFGAEVVGLSIHDALKLYPPSARDHGPSHGHAASIYTSENPNYNPIQRKLQEAVTEHSVLIFRGQLHKGQVLDANDLREFAQWFGCGKIHQAHNIHHLAQAPIAGQLGGGHPDIFRVSNDPLQGCWEPGGVGASGWHNDGAFMPNPYSHVLYQIVSVNSSEDGKKLGSPTMFADLNSAVNAISIKDGTTLDRWFRLTSGKTILCCMLYF